ncbi:unannotated protein [freshwater metagenome]|uniref:Unannotated protein n=1 Tax=freshwater metagenome TaxID=449393 RepID=A0A6J7QCT1_9ZZZZ
MLGEEIAVEERQLDGVGNLLDLQIETTDVRVGDVGNLFEQQILHLGPLQLLEQQIAPGVETHRVAASQMRAAQTVG